MLNARSRLLLIGITAFLAVIVTKIGGYAIVDMGELVHFNCRSQSNRVRCELTHEPLIGRLQTLYLAKTDLTRTRVQSKNDIAGNRIFQLVLVTQLQTEIPLTRRWSRSANEQLFMQRDQLDQFLNTPQAKALSVRTHRPSQLWAILIGLGAISDIVGTKMWLPSFTR